MRPVLSLRDVAFHIADRALFTDVTLHLAPGDRVSLIGRNGAGKSTLCKLIAGDLTPDRGEVYRQPGLKVGYMMQDFRDLPTGTARDYVVAGVILEGDQQREQVLYQVEDVLQRLGVNPSAVLDQLSGGNIRRCVLARALVSQPEVLLLDEPTNHLDLDAIQWLEGMIRAYRGAVLLISHDRTFLANVTNRMMWLDRGTVRSAEKGFAHYEAWMEEVAALEEAELARMSKKLEEENHWLARGVTARRKRNIGRLKKLHELRATMKSQTQHMAKNDSRMQTSPMDATHSGRRVLSVEHLSRTITEVDGTSKCLVKDFSTGVMRGERIGIIGPNGIGKTTLLRLLTGTEPSDGGKVTWGEGVEIAWFDQKREALDTTVTLWETLCPSGGDTVSPGGHKLHVIAYLKQFLFEEKQARSPVGSLSGGEANRLLLAKILLQPSNLLILDEPTNDLDMDSLEALLEMLDDYAGTLLIVSHDRDFLDRLTTRCWAFEGDGEIVEIIGGYSDYALWKGKQAPKADSRPALKEAASARDARSAPRPSAKLSYKQTYELEQLPKQMEALQAEQAALQAAVGDPGLYAKDPAAFQKATVRLGEITQQLMQMEERWLELELLKETLANSA